MDHDEKVLNFKNFINRVDPGLDKAQIKDLESALYALSELSVLGEIQLDYSTALTVYKLVESVRLNGFPKELQM